MAGLRHAVAVRGGEAGVGGGTAVNEVFRTKKIREGSDSRVFIVNFGSENRHDDYKSVKKHI